MSVSKKICDIARQIAGDCAENTVVESLDLTEIILEVEEEFDLIVEDEENIHTIGELITLVDAMIA